MRRVGENLLRAGTGLLLAMLAGCIAAPEPPAPRPPAFYASLASPGARIDAGDAANLINGYRRNLGLPDVAVDAALMQFAEAEARALAASGRVDATRNVPLDTRLRSASVRAPVALENVSAGYHTMSDAFSGWRGSPKHDATLRLARATRMGIATAYDPASKYKVYWALVLAGP